MKKRVCENCRFFLEAGFAKNGWCNNPQRKETNDVILVVRKNELACRGTWANDLFVPRTAVDPLSDIADSVLHDSKPLQPLSPARAEEMTFLVNGHRDKSQFHQSENSLSAHPVDVVVGQMPSTNPAADRAPLLSHDNRAAILKARERHRQRHVTEKRHMEPVGLTADPVNDIDVVASRDSRLTSQTPIAPFPPRNPQHHDVAPVQRSEISRSFPTITSFPEDDARFLSVPEPVAGFELPRRMQPPVSEPLVVTDRTYSNQSAGQDSVMSYTTTHRRFDQNEQPIADFKPEIASGADDWEQSEPIINAGDHFYGNEATDVPAYESIDEQVPMYRHEKRRFDFSGWRRAPRHQSTSFVDVHTDIESNNVEAEWFDEIDESRFVPEPPLIEDQVLAHFKANEELQEPFDIAPQLPRMCQTCRDFRPADSGGRGWCNNKWAFVHSRMVDAEALPCETSVGVWWLPHDDVWLASADFSSHSQPTPLVDLWLTRTVQDDTDMVSERRRKRS